MSEKSLYIFCGFGYWPTDYDKGVVRVAQPPSKKVSIASNERCGFLLMEISEDFVEILPLGTTYVTTNLLWPEPFPAQDFDFVLRDIMVKEDHAAVFVFGSISRTMPLELRVAAS